MFEDRTYETLLEESLALITSDIDKQEGSLIRTAIAPAIYKLSELYIQLDNFIDLVFGDTAVGEYLDRVVSDYGLERKQATNSIREVTTSGVISLDTRWSINETTYKITSKINDNLYHATCEQSGEIGNLYDGILEPLDFVGEVTATLSGIVTNGTEIESDENLRSRFLDYLQKPSASGNANNYRQWALEVAGVGDAKVFPIWNGNGTVKVLVVDSDKDIDVTLPATVYNHIESVRPIGAIVTVESPAAKTITISATVNLDGTKTLTEVKLSFDNSILNYLKSTIFTTYNLSYAKIGSLLLDTQGVQDYTNLLVNGAMSNVAILDTEIPTMGITTLTEGV